MLGYIYRFKLKNVLFLIVALSFIIIIKQVYYYELSEIHPVLLWWTPFVPENDRIISCENDQFVCKVGTNRLYQNEPNLKAVLFYGSNWEPFDLPLPKRTLWAIFHEESPRNVAVFLHNETQNLFDFTATFSRFSDFPVTLMYLENINSITDKKYYVDVKRKNELLEHLAPVLYIQSDCDTPIDRDKYVTELMKYIKVDSYGACLKNRNFSKEMSDVYHFDLFNGKLLKFVSRYKFVIAFENAICDDYITEKLWRPLIVGSVPIYLGSPTIKDWLPNRNSAILADDFESPQSLAEFIHKINRNDVLYEGLLQHKLANKIDSNLLRLFSKFETAVTAFECFICKKIHEKTAPHHTDNKSVYNCPWPTNSWSSHWLAGKCQTKALKELLGKEQNFTKETYDRLWFNYLENGKC